MPQTSVTSSQRPALPPSGLRLSLKRWFPFQDTLRRIKKRYETDCKEYGREPTVPVEKSVAEAKKEADQMFFDVLGRKDRADATRNALNVMNR